MEDNENFCCPVTSELFTDPTIIPECGHTFDRSVLIKLENKKCPVCNIEFHDLPQDLPTNWLAVSHLNLSIKPKEDKNSKDKDYDADQAYHDCRQYIETKSKIIIKDIIIQIKKRATKGNYYVKFNISQYCDAYDPMDEIKKKIISVLEAKKYNVVSSIEYGIVYFTIKWN